MRVHEVCRCLVTCKRKVCVCVCVLVWRDVYGGEVSECEVWHGV